MSVEDAIWIVAAVGLGGLWFYQRGKDKGLLAAWAQENDLRLVEARHAPLEGPFFWPFHHAVYRITVESPDGSQRTGWARMTLFGDGVVFKWDDQK